VEVNLCEAWKEMIEQEKISSIEKIMTGFNVTLERACEVIGCSVDEYNEFKGLA
jgi:hypothetical protein